MENILAFVFQVKMTLDCGLKSAYFLIHMMWLSDCPEFDYLWPGCGEGVRAGRGEGGCAEGLH